MKFFFITFLILFSPAGRAQTDTISEADLHASEKLIKDFIAFDSNYLRKRAELGGRAKALAVKVFELEKKGYTTSCIHQVLYEAGSLLYSTACFKKIDDRLNDLEELLSHPGNLPDADEKDSVGSYGKCYNEWYLKVDKSYDQLEKKAGENPHPSPLPRFLERINTPEKLEDYLNSVSISDVSKTGVDNEGEFNAMLATLIQMIIRGRPQNYIVDSSLKTTLMNLILYKFRNPETGWWGERYIRNGDTEFVDDLSITFHTISYLKGKVPDMNKVTNTLLTVKYVPYPVGWLWKNEYWNHNNMDVVTLFQYGWQQTNKQQQNRMRNEIDSMLQWCLNNSLQSDGSFKAIPADGSVEEAEYYGVSFLARIGYFDKSKRFWTDKDFPEAAVIREKLITYIKAHQSTGGSGGDYYKSALEDLGVTK